MISRAEANRRQFYRRALAFCAMLAVAMFYRAQCPTDWDAWDYCAQAVRGHPSDLLFGRWWFVVTMRVAYLLGRAVFGIGAAEAYLPMQTAAAFIMAGALVAGMAWTYRLTGSRAAEVIFAAIILTGPTMGIYASAIMTEGMTLLMLAIAMWAWQRAICAPRRAAWWALAGGLCFGVAVNIREPAGLLCAWPVISCIIDRPRHGWRLLLVAAGGACITFGVGILGAWAWYPWQDTGYFGNIGRWTASMVAERHQLPVSLKSNLNYLLSYSIAASPTVTLLVGPAILWSLFRKRRMFWLAVATLPYLLSLMVNHDLSVNPRFPIPAVWMLTPVVAAAVGEVIVAARRHYRTWLAAAVILSAGISVVATAAGWGYLENYYFEYVSYQRRMYLSMQNLPDDAVVIAGPGTPVALHLNRLGEKRFNIIASGWDWPGKDLDNHVAELIHNNRRVYVNLDKRYWSRGPRDSGEWEQLRAAAGKYRIAPAVGPLFELREIPTETQPDQAY